MRFVPVKSVEQQSMLCVHRLREGIKADRTACINRIRGLLAEFGLVFAQGPEALSSMLADVLEDGSNEMNALARRVIEHARAQWRELDAHRLVRRANRPARQRQRRGAPGRTADGHRPHHCQRDHRHGR
jgi:transposase